MIVTCPNCYCQFKVGLAVFGREGRNVRCSACRGTWWQEPTLEDVVEEIVEEIPQDVSEPDEVEETDELDEAEEEVLEEAFVRNSQERVEGYKLEQGQKLAYYIAAGLFFVILLYLLLVSSSMLKAHPSMQSFYRLFGISIDLPDTMSIMFESVKAEREGTAVTASGRIVNLSSKEWALPMIEVVVFRPVIDIEGDSSEEVIAQWVEKPPEPTLDAEMEIPFSFSRHVSLSKIMHDSEPSEADDGHGDTSAHGLEEAKGEHKDMYMVRVHFVVKPRLEVEEEAEDKEVVHEAEEHKEAAADESDHGVKDSHDTVSTHDTGH